MQRLTSGTECLKNLFKPLQLDYVFDSIEEGFTPAEVYVDNPANPSIAVVCEAWCFYFGGVSSDPAALDRAASFFAAQILTPERKEKLGSAKLYCTSPQWEDALQRALAAYNPKRYPRVLFRHSLQNIPELATIDGSLVIRPIDRDIVDGQLTNINWVIHEVNQMWGSTENFLKNGFGSCAVVGAEIVCWCTTEYMSGKSCGLGIETVEDQQKKGIAPRAVVEVLQQCAARNRIPHWDSWLENVPSVRVAEKTGFEKVLDYDVIFIRFGQ